MITNNVKYITKKLRDMEKRTTLHIMKRQMLQMTKENS